MTINPFDDAMSVPRRHSRHRPRSPTKRHRAYSPSTRADDISRLLDPAYASPTSSARRAEGVYVDHRGELHDPDFKLFPPLPKPKAPRWEREDSVDDLDALADDDEPRETRRYTPSPSYTPTSYSAPSSYTRVSPYTAVLPASYDSEDTVLGSVAPSFDDEKHPKSRRSALKLRMRRRRRDTDATAFTVEEEESSPSDSPSPQTPELLTPELPRSLYPQHPPSPRRVRRASTEELSPPVYDDEDEIEEEVEEEEEEEEPAPHTPEVDETPSCTSALRLQWQAFTLRMRFGAFRVERKVKRRLGRRKEKT
ncbi:hypothetical protein HDZ31DRAFT_66943 [Schizophyllum fasciatum]